MSVLFFDAIPKYTIWGGKKCNHYFGFDGKFEDGVGQVWAFSAQENGSTVCLTEPFAGKNLREIYAEQPALFGNPSCPFPLIISLVGPEQDLSIQVHPDSAYAEQALGLSMGKNEAWYFLESVPGADIVYGNSAGSTENLRKAVEEDRVEETISYLPVRTGDFVYIPAGQVHALKAGSVVYEIQQSTDVTYRLYDYKRKDKNGNERKLDIEEALACVRFGDELKQLPVQPVTRQLPGMEETVFFRSGSFTVTRLEIDGEGSYQTEPYQLATVVKGSGTVDGQALSVGKSFLIPACGTVRFTGNMTVMMTTKEENV